MRNGVVQQRARALRNTSTDVERFLWRYLRRRQIADRRFRRQVPIGGYIADFVCLESKLVVELDGGQHQTRHHHDTRRDRYIEKRGFKILRFWNNDVLQQAEAVLQQIWQALQPSAPLPFPPPRSGGGSGWGQA
mgnify:CR=1 FL=1